MYYGSVTWFCIMVMLLFMLWLCDVWNVSDMVLGSWECNVVLRRLECTVTLERFRLCLWAGLCSTHVSTAT